MTQPALATEIPAFARHPRVTGDGETARSAPVLPGRALNNSTSGRADA